MRYLRFFFFMVCVVNVFLLAHKLHARAAEGPQLSSGPVIEVRDDNQLRQVLRTVRPGTTIRIWPGQYSGNVYLEGLHGTAEAPIVIEGADRNNPPVFAGGDGGWQISEGSHFVLRNLRFRGQRVNGLNIDDGGSFDTPTHHIRLENLIVEDVGPVGNYDGIKLSGVTDFVITNCRIEGWGGQAIDMVGCHRGLIENCVFKGKEGFSQNTGPQAKGGSSQVTIRRCVFYDAAQRCVQLGGSTGLAFFRPRGVLYEAKDLLVEDCIFVGGDAAVSFVGVDGSVFRHNTIIRPKLWILRILQETREPGFVPCRNGVFERNLIVFSAGLREHVNIGPATAPETFRFAANWWYCEDRPQNSRPRLPVPEADGIYGVNPQLRQLADGRWVAGNPQARSYGARPAGQETGQ